MTASTVYLARDAEATVLYVGCTFAHRFFDRMSEHRYWSGWYPETEQIERREYDDRAKAERAEWVLTAQLLPQYNRAPFMGRFDASGFAVPEPISVSTIPLPLGFKPPGCLPRDQIAAWQAAHPYVRKTARSMRRDQAEAAVQALAKPARVTPITARTGLSQRSRKAS